MSSFLNILGQVFILLNYIIYWISRFCKNKNNLLIFHSISKIFAIIGFFILGTYDGIKNALYVVLRNSLGQITNRKKYKYKVITFCLMLVLLITMYSISFNGISTLCIATCGILNLYGTIMCKEKGIRLFGMMGSICYLSFMILNGNYTGVICETITFIALTISYLKYNIKETNYGYN